jgi:hypothetical protein
VRTTAAAESGGFSNSGREDRGPKKRECAR